MKAEARKAESAQLKRNGGCIGLVKHGVFLFKQAN
jgi:hypothetical protein